MCKKGLIAKNCAEAYQQSISQANSPGSGVARAVWAWGVCGALVLATDGRRRLLLLRCKFRQALGSAAVEYPGANRALPGLRRTILNEGCFLSTAGYALGSCINVNERQLIFWTSEVKRSPSAKLLQAGPTPCGSHNRERY